jgi:hypothetical protein
LKSAMIYDVRNRFIILETLPATNELDIGWNGRNVIQVLFRHLPGVTEEYKKNHGGVTTEIRIPNQYDSELQTNSFG